MLIFLFFAWDVSAQNVIDLRKLTNEDWEKMSTEERLTALNTTNNRAMNQTLVGKFNRYDELYKKWGYDYYEMYDRYEDYLNRFDNYTPREI